MDCNKCGAKLKNDSLFCTNCGAEISQVKKVAQTKSEREPKTKKYIKDQLLCIIAIILMLSIKIHIINSANDTGIESCDYKINVGLADQYNGSIYYIGDQAIGSAIYRMNTNGTEKTKIYKADSSIKSLNVAQGWVYFVKNREIYRIRIDGTKIKRLSSKIHVDKIYVKGEYIYFNSTKGIFKIKASGGKPIQITEDVSDQIFVYSNWVYYISHDSGYLYKIRTDGSELTKFNTYATSINVVGDWIYFNNSTLYKMKTDGTELTNIYDASGSELVVSNDWIYFENIEPRKAGYLYHTTICKVKTNGTGFTQLDDDWSTDSIAVVGNWVFYMGDSKIDSRYQRVYMMRTDGTDIQIAGEIK